MDIQESNKLIAAFMGGEDQARFVGGNKTFLFDKKNTMGVTRCRSYGYDDLKYHESWDWLMPVVERIEGLQVNGRYIDVEMLPDATLIGFQEWEKEEAPIVNVNKSGEFDGLFETRLQGTYEAVVAFIKWYNQNK